MKVLMCGVCLVAGLGSLACASNSEPEEPEIAETHIEPSMCEPLLGVYRITYAVKDGDCGDLPVQLATFRDATTMSALSSQCNGSVDTSENLCERNEDGDCEVLDGTGASIGNAHLSSMFKQTSDIRIEGSTTIHLTGTDGFSCTSSYALIGDRLRDAD